MDNDEATKGGDGRGRFELWLYFGDWTGEGFDGPEQVAEAYAVDYDRAEGDARVVAVWDGATALDARHDGWEAVRMGGVEPTTGLELPAVRGRRDRIVSPEQAARLLEALPERDQAMWATALYGGLRRGELQALRWEDVDLAKGVIKVERAWDVRAGQIEPKSRAGRRTVPIPVVLRDYLVEHRQPPAATDTSSHARTASRSTR